MTCMKLDCIFFPFQLRSIELNGVDQSEEINQQGILVIDDITSDKMPEQPRLLFKVKRLLISGH